MGYYVVKRLLAAVLVLIGVTVLAFAMLHLMPGDPVRVLMSSMEAASSQTDIEQVRARFGLNDPLPVQYLNFVKRAVTGDLGRSVLKGRPVATMIAEVYPYTLQLAFAALAIAMLAGISLGVLAALRHNTLLDHFAMLLAIAAFTTPPFVLSLFLIVLFAVRLPLLPPGGWETPSARILPVLVLAAGPTAMLARYTRASVLDVITQDYIRTARAKGLRERTVVLRHLLRGALLPVITILGPVMAGLVTGSFVVETVFRVPGVGRLFVDAVFVRDYPLIMGTTLLYAVAIALANLVVDVLYAVVDPRITYA
jgi:ABC-type dipeptide/oligopeptide/nickel transport system permease component